MKTVATTHSPTAVGCAAPGVLSGAAGNPVEGDAIALAQACLSEQGIVAVKGLGGFHLACKIDQEETLRKLRQRKHRDEKPFAIMCASVDEARKLCYITPEEEVQLTSFRRPIVLLRKRTGTSPYLSENLT